jgi:ribonuclease-3
LISSKKGECTPPPIEEVLGYTFKDPKLLDMALTHPSVMPKINGDYERLEFLGDRVFGVIIADYLYRHFPEEKEGVLAKKISALISRHALAKVAVSIGFGRYIKLSPGELKTGGNLKLSSLADSLEAVIGAIYLDGGLQNAEAFVLAKWDFLLKTISNYALADAKSTLQELAQVRGWGLPEYQLLSKEGEEHHPIFTMGVRLSSKDPFVEGQGHSKQLAQKDAAVKLLEILQKDQPKGAKG